MFEFDNEPIVWEVFPSELEREHRELSHRANALIRHINGARKLSPQTVEVEQRDLIKNLKNLLNRLNMVTDWDEEKKNFKRKKINTLIQEVEASLEKLNERNQ